MSTYHGAVSRRDFMKGLGLVGAGLGAAAAVGPAFHDLDEVAASGLGAVHKWSWWVKENEINNPTVEIDWAKASRFDSRHVQQCSWQGNKEIEAWMNLRDGPGTFAKLTKDAADRKQKGLTSGDPWYDLRNKALTGGLFLANLNYSGPQDICFTGPNVPTPETLGVPRWTGTPEEASIMLKQVMILYGASDVAFLELDPEKARNMIFSHEFHDGKPYSFEDVDKASETGPLATGTKAPVEGKRVIPNKTRWVAQYSFDESEEWLGRFGEEGGLRYPMGNQVRYLIQAFLKGLGYQAIGPMNYTNNLSENIGMAVLGGTSELGRNNLAISPKFGAVQGECASIITDLPLVPTKPIDAGIRKFCETCMKCAELCPGGALSRNGNPTNAIVKEPTWGGVASSHRWTERTKFESQTPTVFRQSPGINEEPFYKHWWYTPSDCSGRWYDICGSFGCCVSCPFSSGQTATVHGFVRATAAITPILNTYMRQLDDTFYGREGRMRRDPKDLEAFWKGQVDLPRMGVDSMLSTDGRW